MKIADTVELKIGYELPGGYKCGLFVATRQYVTTNVNRTINKTPNILKLPNGHVETSQTTPNRLNLFNYSGISQQL